MLKSIAECLSSVSRQQRGAKSRTVLVVSRVSRAPLPPHQTPAPYNQALWWDLHRMLFTYIQEVLAHHKAHKEKFRKDNFIENFYIKEYLLQSC